MVVSGKINNKTSVYKTLYDCYRKRFKKQYDFCVKHAVFTAVGAFLFTLILNAFGANVSLVIAAICHVSCGVAWFFGDRWALRKRFNDHDWNVEAGYVREEKGLTAEDKEFLHIMDMTFFSIRDMNGDTVGVTCRQGDVNKDLEDGALIWYNIELHAIFLRKEDTVENGEIK